MCKVALGCTFSRLMMTMCKHYNGTKNRHCVLHSTDVVLPAIQHAIMRKGEDISMPANVAIPHPESVSLPLAIPLSLRKLKSSNNT